MAHTAEGEHTGPGRYPVINVMEAWGLWSMLGVTLPGGVHCAYDQAPDGRRTAILVHNDGSWARATGHPGATPTIHQSGPHRLWDHLDDIRAQWLHNGAPPSTAPAPPSPQTG